jgi:hypothetical protein
MVFVLAAAALGPAPAADAGHGPGESPCRAKDELQRA